MSQSVQQAVLAAASRWNAANPGRPPIDPNILLGIAFQESDAGDNTTPNINRDKNGNIVSIDYGVMQLNSKSFPGAANLSEADNISTGAAYFGQLMSTFNGDFYQAISAYNEGAGNVHSKGITNEAYVNNVLKYSGTGGTYTSVTPDGTSVLTQAQSDSLDIQPITGAYSSPNNNTQNIDLSTLAPQIVIQEGLDVQAWYDDSGLITGNPRLRNNVQPVSFQVMLHDNSNFILSSGGEAGIPIRVELNASMKSINLSMKHVYHHQRTRTAHHVTMWGMQADMIEGQCTTGVFMNQFGLTDYYSTRIVNDKLKNLVTSGDMFKTLSNAEVGNINNLSDAGGEVFIQQVDGDFQKSMQLASRDNPNFAQSNAFRVAAQDAFMEFLALFKMNGSVWFWNKLYSDNMGNTRDWVGVQAWSPVLGMNGAQKNARNNDVVTRGGVLMSYRNFVYQGYFKTLQWTMDAANPFKWDFSFTFQVERTVGQQAILG